MHHYWLQGCWALIKLWQTAQDIQRVIFEALNSLRPSDTYIFVSKYTIIGSDNGLVPNGLVPTRWWAIICTNDRTLLIWPLGTGFSEILKKIHIFSFNKMCLKISSATCWPFYLSLNVLNTSCFVWPTLSPDKITIKALTWKSPILSSHTNEYQILYGVNSMNNTANSDAFHHQ